MAKKVIHIFLGSSINEFQLERLQLTEFMRELSDRFEDAYDIKIKPVICENVDTNVPRGGGKQAEYNELIRKSEMCFFIFFTRAGEFTCEEFEVAYKSLCETGKPKTYVYFKNVAEGVAVDPSLAAFKARIDDEIKHYHGTFDDIDTIKLRILLNLKLQEMDFLEVKYKDGRCYAGGAEVKGLDIDKVSEFKNNVGLKELRAELNEVEREYFALKARYDKSRGDEAFYKNYSEVAARRANLIKQIEDTEGEIFSLSLNMSKNSVRGEITARQAMAYELFEKGDLQGANNILDFDEIKSEYLRRKAIREAEQRKDDIRYIREIKTKIEVLEAMTGYAGRFEEIEELYGEIVPIAEESLVEIDVIFDYAVFLDNQNKLSQAAGIYARLEEIFEYNEQLADDNNLSRLYNNAANLYRHLRDYAKAGEYYIKAIAVCEALAGEYPDIYNYALALSYNNAGNLYGDLHDYDKSECYYLKAAAIREVLAEENPAENRAALADTYANLGILYNELNRYEQAGDYHLKAVSIREKLAEENPAEHNPALAACYNNLGILYSYRLKRDKAEEYYLKAAAIYEKSAEENPAANAPFLAMSYLNLSALYDEMKDYNRATEYGLKAAALYGELAAKNPSAYNYRLAVIYNNVGNLYGDLKDYDKNIEYHLKAVALYKELAKENAMAYAPGLALSCINVGASYFTVRDYSKAEEYYLKALSIYEALVKDKPSAYNKYLSGLYYNLGRLYDALKDKEKALNYKIKAAELYEELYAQNPDMYKADLKGLYNMILENGIMRGDMDLTFKYMIKLKDLDK